MMIIILKIDENCKLAKSIILEKILILLERNHVTNNNSCNFSNMIAIEITLHVFK